MAHFSEISEHHCAHVIVQHAALNRICMVGHGGLEEGAASRHDEQRKGKDITKRSVATTGQEAGDEPSNPGRRRHHKLRAANVDERLMHRPCDIQAPPLRGNEGVDQSG